MCEANVIAAALNRKCACTQAVKVNVKQKGKELCFAYRTRRFNSFFFYLLVLLPRLWLQCIKTYMQTGAWHRRAYTHTNMQIEREEETHTQTEYSLSNHQTSEFSFVNYRRTERGTTWPMWTVRHRSTRQACVKWLFFPSSFIVCVFLGASA